MRMTTTKGFLRNRLANGLKQLRGNTSQNQFARRLGIDASSLNRIENQQQNVSLDTLEKLCRNLECDLADLFPRGESR
jgi:DNA-binding Xre family transcriptional regulator